MKKKNRKRKIMAKRKGYQMEVMLLDIWWTHLKGSGIVINKSLHSLVGSHLCLQQRTLERGGRPMLVTLNARSMCIDIG